MNNRNRLHFILFAILMAQPLACFSQRIVNVEPAIEGDQIHIYYDLLGIGANESVFVNAYLSTDGGETYGEPLQKVTGDVGVVVGPGEKKRITWDVFEEVDELVSVNVKFKVKADLMPSSITDRSQKRRVKLDLNANFGSKHILDYRSFGFNLKGVVYFERLGLGVRGGYFQTFRGDIDYTEGNTTYPDTGYYWGYAGGATIEYDVLSNSRYSLYPFFYLGQSKILYRYNPDFKKNEYFRYSIFGSIGVGFDTQIVKPLFLGLELEYYLSPWIDVVPSDTPDEGLDGICIGFVVKFVIDTG